MASYPATGRLFYCNEASAISSELKHVSDRDALHSDWLVEPVLQKIVHSRRPMQMATDNAAMFNYNSPRMNVLREGRPQMSPIFEETSGGDRNRRLSKDPMSLHVHLSTQRDHLDRRLLNVTPRGESSLENDTGSRTQQKDQSVSTAKVNSNRSGRGKNRSKKRRPHLRCPICHRVWASEWEGLCSHAVAVHGINFQGCPSIKKLLELRAQKMNVINASVQREVNRSGEMDNEFPETPAHYTGLETMPGFNADFQDNNNNHFNPGTKHQKFDSEHRNAPTPRNVRSLSDFGVIPNSDCHSIRGRSASITPLNAPQLEDIYQTYRQLRAREQAQKDYVLRQEDKSHIFDLVRPTVVAELLAIDFDIDEQIIGKYALKSGSSLDV